MAMWDTIRDAVGSDDGGDSDSGSDSGGSDVPGSGGSSPVTTPTGSSGGSGTSRRTDPGVSPDQRSDDDDSGGLDDWGGEPGSEGDPTPDDGSDTSGRTDPGVSPDQRSGIGDSGGLENWRGEPGSGGPQTAPSDDRESTLNEESSGGGSRQQPESDRPDMTGGLEDEPTQREAVNQLQERLREEEGLQRWQYDIEQEGNMLRANVAESVRQRRARRQAAEQFGEGVESEDVVLSGGDDGTYEATLSESAQREMAADQISEQTGIPEDQFDVVQTDEGFEADFGDQAAETGGMWDPLSEAVGEQAVREQVAEEEGIDAENVSVERTEEGYDASVDVSVGRTDPGGEQSRTSQVGSGGTTGNITGIETGGDASASAESDDIDWSFGFGGPEDEIENYIDTLRPRAEGIVAPRLEEGAFVEQYGVEAQPSQGPGQELARRTASDAALGLATAPAVLAQDVGEFATEGTELGVSLLAQDSPSDEAAVPDRYTTQYGTGEPSAELDRAADKGVTRAAQAVQYYSDSPSELGGVAAVTAVSAPLSVAAASRVPGLGSDVSGRLLQSGAAGAKRVSARAREFARAERGQADLTGPSFGDETTTLTGEDFDVGSVDPDAAARRRPPMEDVGDIDPGSTLARRRERAQNPEPDRSRDIAFRRSLSDDSPTRSGEFVDETGSVRSVDTFDPMAEELAVPGALTAAAASAGLDAAQGEELTASPATDMAGDTAVDTRMGLDARQDMDTRVDTRQDVGMRADLRTDTRMDSDLRADLDTRVDTRTDVREDTRVDLESRTDLRTDTERDLDFDRERRRRDEAGGLSDFSKEFESDVAAPGEVLGGDNS